MLKTGPTVTALVAISFLTVALQIPRDAWASTAALSLGSGVAALSLMAWAAVLGGRWRFVEAAFGGLDRVYETHKWLGVWALGLASFHLVFSASSDAWTSAAIVPLPRPATRLIRQLSFVVLMLIVLLALNRKIPYSVWRWWHKLSGPSLLVVIAHWLTFKSPIALLSPAGLWLATVSALGAAAALYKLLLYPLLSNHAEYRLVAVSPSDSAARLELAPVKRGLDFAPGQFAFVAWQHPGLREPHPFTIASADRPDGHIAFVIRALGDYTGRLLAEATPGMRASVYAPFGRFERAGNGAREIWVAGGVGITPFLAWLQDERADGLDRVTLFYFYTPGRGLPETVDLETLAQRRGVEYIPITTGPGTPSFVQRFARIVGDDGASPVRISFCGPKGLLKRLRSLMHEHGVADTQLHYEQFEFR
ncbi:ferric reductase-like transmembrane domain-containing protein [Lysobacter cavernae]|uniref:Ferric reductase-like transmembrane domain-containing protein n=1 Tax=Lysobacter cavernae TaxID=1685901 RepID=A0ABV7RTR8_9GAMM